MNQNDSEYTTEQHIYPSKAKLDVFHNLARFDTHSRSFVISVDPSFEICFIQDVEKDYKYELLSYLSYVTREGKSPEDIAIAADYDQWVLQKQKLRIEQLNQKYPGMIDRSFIEKANADYFRVYSQKEGAPDAVFQRAVHLLSGCTITLNCGEGILDFIYADFSQILEDAVQRTYERSELLDKQPFLKTHPKPSMNHFHQHMMDIEDLEHTSDLLKNMLYCSIYTAICPPIFRNLEDSTIELEHYKNYLEDLQEEYRYLMKLCFDETYYPEILDSLPPAKRFWLYRRGHKLPTALSRKENLLFTTSDSSKYILPPGAFINEHIPTLTLEDAITPEISKHEDAYMDLADEMGLESLDLLELLRMPNHVSVGYSFSQIDEILALEFSKVLEYGIHFRKCKRCGKYFIMKGNYDTNYCDRIAQGETRTCQEIAAAEKYRAKIADDKAIPIYNKYYKRYAARVKVQQIKEEAFKKWRYQAISLRDDCSNGKITPEEYIQWMEDSFPNRKPKT